MGKHLKNLLNGGVCKAQTENNISKEVMHVRIWLRDILEYIYIYQASTNYRKTPRKFWNCYF